MEKMSASANECALQAASHRCVRWQKKKIETKTRKNFFGVEVCALDFARVWVRENFVCEHRERGNQVGEFVELENSPQVTAVWRRQVTVARQVVVVAKSQGTQADFGWQQSRV